jgi:hypothetical protein
MSSALPEDVQSTLTNLDMTLSALEEHFEPLFEAPWDVLTARLDPLEKAKLNLMMAYSAASLFFMYLKTQVVKYLRCQRKNCISSLAVLVFEREYPQKIIPFRRNLEGFIRTSAN